MLPGSQEGTIISIEERLAVLTPVSTMVNRGFTPEEILAEILGKENVQILEKIDVKYRCSCSKERVLNTLASLGREEIVHIIETEGQAEVKCHFCNEKYYFSGKELEELVEQSK